MTDNKMSASAESAAEKKSFKVTFDFDDERAREGFLTWFLDAAGDQHYWEAADYWIESAPRRGAESWPRATFKGWPPSAKWQGMPEIVIEAPTAPVEE